MCSAYDFVWGTCSDHCFYDDKKNLKRLTDFSVELQNFQPDDLSHHYEIEYMDEIGVLKDSFNKMIERINDLVISEYQARISSRRRRFLSRRWQCCI